MNGRRFTLASVIAALILLLTGCSHSPAPQSEAPQAPAPTLSAQPSTATICVVGGACYPSLQAAIDAANAGDTTALGAGVDTEAGIVVTKNLTIQGQGAGQSIVQGAASPATATNRVFWADGGVTATLKDLTVRRGTSPTAMEGTSAGQGPRAHVFTLRLLQHCRSHYAPPRLACASKAALPARFAALTRGQFQMT